MTKLLHIPLSLRLSIIDQQFYAINKDILDSHKVLALQEALQTGVKELLQRQQAEEKQFRNEVSAAMDKLLGQNNDLRSQCQKQEKLLQQQKHQIEGCSQAMTNANEANSSPPPPQILLPSTTSLSLVLP